MADYSGTPDQDALAQLERKPLSGKRLVMLGVPAGFVLVLSIVGVLSLIGGGGGKAKAHKEYAEAEKPAEAKAKTEAAPETLEGAAAAKPDTDAAPVFCEAIDYLVNLNTGGPRATYLKLQVQFEVAGEQSCGQLDAILPRINGDFQSFLRELRPRELSGSASNHRLKEELLVRVNRSAAQAKVLDVHITEFLVQ